MIYLIIFNLNFRRDHIFYFVQIVVILIIFFLFITYLLFFLNSYLKYQVKIFHILKYFQLY